MLQTLLTAMLRPAASWQIQARRNAWAAMAADVQRARARAEADAALALAAERWRAGEARAAR